MGCVYCINFPNGKKYIGMTKHTAEYRFEQHKAMARKGNKRGVLYSAMRKYGADNCVLEVVFSSDGPYELQNKEVSLIEELNTICPNGYNSTIGGDGVSGLISEIKEKAVEKTKITMATPEYIQKQKDIQSIVWNDDFRAKRSKEIKKMWENPLYRQHMVDAHIGFKHTEETKNKKAKSSKEVWQREGFREKAKGKLKELWKTDEMKNKQKEGILRNKDKHKEIMKEILSRPEVLKKMSESGKRRFDDPKARKQASDITKKMMEDPDARFKISETLSQYKGKTFIKNPDFIYFGKAKRQEFLLNAIGDIFTYRDTYNLNWIGRDIDRMLKRGCIRILNDSKKENQITPQTA